MRTGGISKRLERLEAAHSPPCEECGHARGAPGERFSVEWAKEPDAAPEFCGKCGRQLVYVVTWGDEPGEG